MSDKFKLFSCVSEYDTLLDVCKTRVSLRRLYFVTHGGTTDMHGKPLHGFPYALADYTDYLDICHTKNICKFQISLWGAFYWKGGKFRRLRQALNMVQQNL